MTVVIIEYKTRTKWNEEASKKSHFWHQSIQDSQAND